MAQSMMYDKDHPVAHTCRDEILAAITRLELRCRRRVFKLHDIVAEVKSFGNRDSTIRTHVTSRMCANAPDNHAVVYRDLLRVAPGEYRRI